MSDVKQVKVDNWGIYFLQRLKHFFNRTDYCDLTLQFQDNAQLKVHRLVLSACTEYFELLERTCEMYEDCLVMPDDLQADVVVPIVNFMYTGQLEFKMELLESLYQTSQIMNMPVLTKLLDAHRNQPLTPKLNYNATRRSYSKNAITPTNSTPYKTTPNKTIPKQSIPSNISSNKRSHTKAFGSPIMTAQKEKRQHLSLNKSEGVAKNGSYGTTPIIYGSPISAATRKAKLAEPRPTRYELPEEIESEEVFEDSFTNISYTSQPLIVHPETTKRYAPNNNRGIFNEASSSNRKNSTVDIVECKKVSKEINNDAPGLCEDAEILFTTNVKKEERDSSQLFDQILDHEEGPKVTIETKDKETGNIDHAKIISEVLKKYPHLVKSNKNIKLKILNPPSTANTPRKSKKSQPQNHQSISQVHQNQSKADFTFETDVLDSKEAARLIALGAENIQGPWICLICGAPGRALHFSSYYKFRRHLVEVHNEKPVSKMCEYCGLKSLKRNYLLHHLYTKHGIEPPPQYHFPKCNLCDYVALTESFLVKHKLSHGESKNFRCNVCPLSYSTSKDLLAHIRITGHKYAADRRANLQCVYCSKVFLRENNLYAHLKTVHSDSAKADGIIEIYEDDIMSKDRPDIKPNIVKYEPPSYDDENDDDEEEDEPENQYHIEHNPDGNMQVVSRKPTSVTLTHNKQIILNSGLTTAQPSQKAKPLKSPIKKPDFVQEPANKNQGEEIVMIDNNEYVLKGNQLILRKNKINANDEFIIPETEANLIQSYSSIHEAIPGVNITQQKMTLDKARNLNQPIQIVVSNEEEYKALMGSNHSIIFDETDSSKTLTVLSTPHNSLNATSLDISNAQANDMMIIPNNFQLNTPEDMSVDNPNIVVVYSDQIISSQDIGAQFVQSSAVVTQNYETVTTTTPVMTAHVIDTQDVDTWQKNIVSNIDTQQTEIILSDELQPIEEETELASVEHVENITNDSLDELPAVNIVTEINHQVLPPITNSNTAVQSNDEQVTDENNMEVVDQLTQNVSQEAMEIENIPKKTVLEHSDQAVLTVISNKPQNTQSLINEGHLIDESAIIEHGPEISETEEAPEEPQIEQPATIELHELSEQTANVIQIEESANQPEENSQESIENTDVDDQENLTQESIVPENELTCETDVSMEENISSLNVTIEENVSSLDVTIKENVSSLGQEPSSHIDELKQNYLPKTVAPVQLQTLTSEWSEDEEEPEQELDNPVEGDLSMDERSATTVMKSPERRQSTEETIENIQHEMQKQIDNTETKQGQSGNYVVKEQQHESQDQQTLPPQEKLTSLLNDWEDNEEDNDSQDLPQSNEQGQETQNVSEKVDKEKENDKHKEPKNQDKIKSLVSDWDDVDEEDNKN